jgi:hypothetical protein
MKNGKSFLIFLSIVSSITLLASVAAGCTQQVEEDNTSLEGKYTYADFAQPSVCGGCHQNLHQNGRTP